MVLAAFWLFLPRLTAQVVKGAGTATDPPPRLAPGDAGAGGVELKFRFDPGDKYFLSSSIEQRITSTVRGEQRVVEKIVRLGCDLNVEEVEEDGSFWARYTYKRAAVRVNGPELDIQFDSEVSQPWIPLEVLPTALTLEEGFYFESSPQGDIDKINGLQAVVSSAKGKLPGIPEKNQVIEGIESQYSEDSIRRVLSNQFSVFPDSSPNQPRLTEIGDTWSRTERKEDDNLVEKRTYQLKSRIGGVAVVDVNVVFRPIVDANDTLEKSVTGDMGVVSRRETSGHGSGRMEIDEKTGCIIESEMTKDLVQQIRYFAKGPILRLPTAPEPIVTHTVSTFKMTLLEKRPAPAEPVIEPNQSAE